jgi:hypothetical protein
MSSTLITSKRVLHYYTNEATLSIPFVAYLITFADTITITITNTINAAITDTIYFYMIAQPSSYTFGYIFLKALSYFVF